MAKPTIKELEDSILLEYQEERRRMLAIKLGICPECGSKLIQETTEIFDKPIIKEGFLGLWNTIKYYKIWDYRRVCSKNKNHHEYKCNYDDFQDGLK